MSKLDFHVLLPVIEVLKLNVRALFFESKNRKSWFGQMNVPRFLIVFMNAPIVHGSVLFCNLLKVSVWLTDTI